MTDEPTPANDDSVAAPGPDAPGPDAPGVGAPASEMQASEAPKDEFEAQEQADAARAEDDADALIVNIEGFEGPLDLLLQLARTQKVDLKKISILALAEQYLAFVQEAKLRRLDLAAEYLVMAAWLTYLKSRLMLPEPETDDDEPTGEELAARLAFQLQRLEAMRAAADKILALPRLGAEVFSRGAPEGVRVKRKTEWTASLYDLLSAYSEQRIKGVDSTYHIEKPKVYTLEDARTRLIAALGGSVDWSSLESFLPNALVDAPKSSQVASTLSAALELARDGRMEIRQMELFGPVYIRQRAAAREMSA